MAIKNKQSDGGTPIEAVQEQVVGEETGSMDSKTVIRGIGQNARYDVGVYTGTEVDSYISSLLRDGWKLAQVNFLYTMNDPSSPSVPLAYVFAWHLVK